MADQKQVVLHFPAGGEVKRYAVQHQVPYSTPDGQNIRADSAAVPAGASQAEYIRERGGSRPGISKAFSQQLAGTVAPSPSCCPGVALPTTATITIYQNTTVFATIPVTITSTLGVTPRYGGSHSTVYTVTSAVTTTVAATYYLDCFLISTGTTQFAVPFFRWEGSSPVVVAIGEIANCSPIMVSATTSDVNAYAVLATWRWELNQ